MGDLRIILEKFFIGLLLISSYQIHCKNVDDIVEGKLKLLLGNTIEQWYEQKLHKIRK